MKSYNLQTDAGGNLLSFTITLNGNTEIKVQLPVAPSYSSNSTNSTVAGANILHSLYWQDDDGLCMPFSALTTVPEVFKISQEPL